MEWDLTNLYLSPSDPQILKDKKKVDQLVNSFSKNYTHIFDQKDISPNIFFEALIKYEEILNLLYIYISYAAYRKSQNTASSSRAKFNQEAEEFFNNQISKLLFFELGISNLSDQSLKILLDDKRVHKYKNYIIHTQLSKKHNKSESEEIIITKKNQTGHDAFIRLYEEQISALTYKIKIDDKVQNLNYDSISTILASHPDRDIRQKAAISMTNTLSKNTNLFTYIQNTLLRDKQVTDEIRSYDFPQQSTFINYQIPSKVVTSLTKTVSNQYNLVSEFYTYKRDTLGLTSLSEIDRYSNLFETDGKRYSFEEAKKIILEAFGRFSPKFATIAKKFFDNNWIDAKIRKGKVGGAFCSFCVPEKNPYILVNFNGELRDITTLAHELGHGIHAYLSRKQTLLQYNPSIAIAEIASVFCEAIVFEYLLEKEKDKKVKVNLLNNKIQEIFATIFRQNAFYLFESKLHVLRRKEGELSTKQISELFQTELQSMFQDSLTLSEGHRYWWIPVRHFFYYDFYVFTYVFGELLSLTLLGDYKQFGHDFINGYIKMLESGNSLSPIDLIKILGIDINKKGFWDNGIKYINTYVQRYKETISTL